MPDFAALSDLFDGIADIIGGISYFATSLAGGPDAGLNSFIAGLGS